MSKETPRDEEPERYPNGKNEREDSVILVDVGSRGGLQAKWKPHVNRLSPVFIELDKVEADKLRRLYASSIVVDIGLSNITGTRTLHVTKNPCCTSFLEPNFDLISSYPGLKPHFAVVDTHEIPCTRYDILHKEGKVPTPDVIKIDTQGHEFEILLGFGGLLECCYGVELEADFYPLYKDQKLLHEIISLLTSHGFVLRKLKPANRFRGDVVEVDAFFTKTHSIRRRIPIRDRWKYDLISDVWGLS